MTRAIAPSILAADFSKLGEQVKATQSGGADRVHVDVMDGHFVPNLSMGSVVVKGLRPVTTLALEVHLMVEHPMSFVDSFVKAGADTIIAHLEVLPDPISFIRQVRAFGRRVGLAFNPDYDIERVLQHLADIDVALSMTVFPGFGGQAYLPTSNERIAELRTAIDQINPTCELEVDGGINHVTILHAAKAGANVFVTGTAIFGSTDGPGKATQELHRLASTV
jgi:ribulose-phosphate 3-epimerase